MQPLNRFKAWMPYLLAAIVTAGILYAARSWYVCKKGEYEPDNFYNVRIATEGPSVFTAKHFPATTQSAWHDHFSDKELGFHLILWGIVKVGAFLGKANLYPFHLHNIFFVFLLLLAYNAILHFLNIRHPWFWSLLLICAFSDMTYRLFAVRAYLLSMTISLALLYAFMHEGFRQWRHRWTFLFLIGFLESWCYSSPYLLLTTLIPCAIAESLCDHRWKRFILTPPVFCLGMVAGLTFHPQFPNSFLIFRIQSLDVITAFIFHKEPIPIRGGNEFYVSTWRSIPQGNFNYLLVLAILIFMLIWNRRILFPARVWRTHVAFNALLLTTALNFLLSLMVYRFNEYTLAPICLLMAVVFQHSFNEAHDKKWPRRLAYAMTFLCLLYQFHQFELKPAKGPDDVPCAGVAEWAQKSNLPEDTVIANLNWSDFPRLYYVMPRRRFTWGLDPAFTWYCNKKIPYIIHDLQAGVICSRRDLAEAFQAKYLFISTKDYRMGRFFVKEGFPVLYEGWDGLIFDIETKEPEKTFDNQDNKSKQRALVKI